MEEHPSHLAQAPAFRLIYDHMRTNTDWLPLLAEDGHEGVEEDEKIKFFGPTDEPFPLDTFLNSIDNMHNSLLHIALTSERGDYTKYNMGKFKGDGYRKQWRKNMDNTIEMIRQGDATGRKDWGESPNLENLGTTVNFIPHTRGGILSLLPPHQRHPLPTTAMTRCTIIPTQRLNISKRGGRETAKLEHGMGQQTVAEAPHIHFMITPPGLFTPFHHDLPVSFYNYDLKGAKMWLIYPATNYNMETWYATKESDWFRTPQWAFENLKGLQVCITGPGERLLFRPAYFHACFSLTPVIQAAQEFVNHVDLPRVLQLQRQGLELMNSIPEGHDYSRLDETVTSWTTDLETRFFSHFRSAWRTEWEMAMQQVEDDEQATLNREDGVENIEFAFDESEY